MTFNGSKIAIIGAGVMGEALVKGLLGRETVKPSQIIAADPNEKRGEQLVANYGIEFTTDNTEAAAASNIIILSIKPQILDRVLQPLHSRVDHVSLVLSIVAGVKVRTIAGQLLNARVVRAMPNTPGQIGEGITVWTAAHEVMDEQREQARQLLSALGEQVYVDDEIMLDMATALSGSGPAYMFLFMEALIDAGVHMGFSRRIAEKLVLQTMRGSVDYARASGLHPAALRNQVTSPGGTSAAALYELEKGRIRTVISDAVWAAFRRSVELGGDDQ